MIEAIISDYQQLHQVCHQAQQHQFVCIDTEFVRTKTFFAKLGLVQIGFGHKNYLIDVLAIEDLTPLNKLLCDNHCLKVLHAASEDIEIFFQLFKQLPAPVFDTQIAARLLGIGDNIGYANLCQHLLEIEVKKDQTQSNWLARPLSDDQMRYAALDVHYLQSIFLQLQQQLHSVDRWSWALEESARSGQSLIPDTLDLYYLTVKRAWRLKERSLLCLQQLCVWREQTARKDDVPRNRVADNKSLAVIAQKMPTDLMQLTELSVWSPKQIRCYGQQVFAIITDCKQ